MASLGRLQPSATTRSARQALATASEPSKSAPGHPRLGGPLGSERASGLAAASVKAATVTQVTRQPSRSIHCSATRSTVDNRLVDRLQRKWQEGRALCGGRWRAGRLPPGGRPATSSSSGSPLVTLVEIVQPHVSGKVVKADGSQLVVSQQDGLNVTVNTSRRRPTTRRTACVGFRRSSRHRRLRHRDAVVRPRSDRRHNGRDRSALYRRSRDGRLRGDDHDHSFDGTAETLTTDASTVFRDQSGTTTIASVVRGDLVEASGTPGAGDTFAAVTVYVGSSTTSVRAASAGLRLRRSRGLSWRARRRFLEQHRTWDGAGAGNALTPM